MFPHPEDMHRLHQQQHAELIRHHTLVRQARGANPPTHRLREIGLQISTFVLSGRWWKGITALFTHHNHPDRTFTTAVRKCQRSCNSPGWDGCPSRNSPPWFVT
jgi:hypothetical protein